MAFAAINSAPSGTTVLAPITVIEEAFATEPSLKKRVYDAIGAAPQHASLFEDLARYTSTLLARTTTTTSSLPFVPPREGPAAKKRKIENEQDSVDLKDPNLPVQFYVKDVSFSMPQRKKLTLEVTAGAKYLRARNQNTNQIEFGVPIDRIRHALSLPVPDKAQKQFNFCIIPEYSDGVTPPQAGMSAFDCMVFTVLDGPAKTAFSGSGEQLAHNEGETLESLIRNILNENLPNWPAPERPKNAKLEKGESEEALNEKVVRPHRSIFLNKELMNTRNEEAYHVKAFRGSKDGYVFFLRTGILFGFKKPLMFFSIDRIASYFITGVGNHSFDLNLLVKPINDIEGEHGKYAITILDFKDLDKLSDYMKKYTGLSDKGSFSEDLRAPEHKNGKKRDASGTARAGAEEEESELRKAVQDYENQEDEDESDGPDYDPGTEGESEGSGQSSDEESDDEDDDEDEDEDDDDN
ncbi:hypothetical protein N7493_009550 [Penicillium malachiteum]|uniref:Histone chaperone RTT106/FACT complex subunit SPT16-like middle domain-containing protein n=1 Tax=Penicillium malachiteum TaxID=1324776 RepID=A0AAD6MSG5_9EURO|nr:hypothetical protein N7493_009550 [Penicillium malachiteum]